MKKEVNVCDRCLEHKEVAVAEYGCAICDKSLCEDCSEKISFNFEDWEGKKITSGSILICVVHRKEIDKMERGLFSSELTHFTIDLLKKYLTLTSLEKKWLGL